MKFTKLVAAFTLGAAALPAAAAAQHAAADHSAAIAVGATVTGPEGNPVGTIDAVEGEAVLLNTGTHTATLPKNAFGHGDAGLTITVTKDQLNQMIVGMEAKAAAALDAALVAGAAVKGAGGNSLGTVKEVDGESVIVTGDLGEFALGKDVFVADESGLVARVTAADVKASLSGGAAAE